MDAHFLTEIEIKQFKCFTDFKAAGFKRVNLIGGKNNIGKTAFMEACYINVYSNTINSMISALYHIKFARENLNFLHEFIAGNNPQIYDIKILDATKNYVAKSNVSDKLFFVEKKDGIKEYKFAIDGKFTIVNSNEFSIIFEASSNIALIDNFGWTDDELINAFQTIQKQDLEKTLNDYVREFDESIESFKVIGEKPQCKTNGEYRDITEFGDGLKHYISIICALYACENGYLFIDEIDNGIHYSQLNRLWEIIFTLSKKTNCQIFATTHSKEMLESFARVAKKQAEQDISYTTLVKNKDQEIKALTQNSEMLFYSLAQEHEVR